MTNSILLRRVLPLLFVLTALFAACDSASNVGGLEESLETVPNLNLIEGAESVVATVNKDRNRSNFTLTLDGMKENSGVKAGEYAAFCALWDVPINSDNNAYGEVRLHSIENEPYWQGINHIVNNMDRYYEDNEELTWVEVQVAMWSIMDHKKFDMNVIPENELPTYIRGGNFNNDLVEMIIEDVNGAENSGLMDPGCYTAIYAEIPDAQDQIIIVPGNCAKEKGFGVRFRNLSSSADQHEIYLGPGDLGLPSPRVEKHATYVQNGSTEIDFAYNPGLDEISASVGNDYAIFENISSSMPANCSIDDIDRATIWVAAREAGTTVTLSGEYAGTPYSVSADAGGIDQKFYTLFNIDIASGFHLMGGLEISGTFTSSELSKVEVTLGCPI